MRTSAMAIVMPLLLVSGQGFAASRDACSELSTEVLPHYPQSLAGYFQPFEDLRSIGLDAVDQPAQLTPRMENVRQNLFNDLIEAYKNGSKAERTAIDEQALAYLNHEIRAHGYPPGLSPSVWQFRGEIESIAEFIDLLGKNSNWSAAITGNSYRLLQNFEDLAGSALVEWEETGVSANRVTAERFFQRWEDHLAKTTILAVIIQDHNTRLPPATSN